MARALGLAAVLILIISGVHAIDQYQSPRLLLDEGRPDYSAYFAFRMAGSVILAMSIAMLSVVWNDGMLFPRLGAPWRGFSFIFALVCLAGFAGTVALLAVRPVAFFQLAREDSYIEWSSAIVLFLASALMLLSGILLLRTGSRLTGVLALFLCLVLFVTAMEEISWMQRVFGFSTPESLREDNMQGEANFHNIDTSLFENLYYGGVFALLVISPSLAFLFRRPVPLAAVSVFLPSRYALLVGALGTSLCYEMWNIFWIQSAYFFAVLILAVLAGQAARLGSRGDALLFGSATLALVICHLLDLGKGPAMVRRWDDTEFKELFVAAGLLLHASEVFLRARSACQRRMGAHEAQPFGGLSLEKA